MFLKGRILHACYREADFVEVAVGGPGQRIGRGSAAGLPVVPHAEAGILRLWMLAAASAASWVQAACRDVRHVRYRRRLYAVPAPMAAPMTAPPRISLG